MSAHTPGPWQWVRGPQVEPVLVAAGYHLGDAFVLAPNEFGSGDTAVDEANAHLIAAAPELLEALKRAVETIRAFHGIGLGKAEQQEAWTLYQQSPEMKAINAAIAKAKGPA